MSQQSMSQDQFMVNHLQNRIAEITVDYETKIATGTLQLQMLAQERDAALAEVQSLREQLAPQSEKHTLQVVEGGEPTAVGEGVDS